jgi:hypothetical protein
MGCEIGYLALRDNKERQESAGQWRDHRAIGNNGRKSRKEIMGE